MRFAALLLLAVVIIGASLVAGSTEIGMKDAAAAVLGAPGEPAHTVVMELRVPRVLSALAIGALLAVAGTLLQALFRNPLADSYVLGVSGGSSLGALLALLVGGSLWLVQASAAAGAVLATLLVLALARGGGTVRVLLTGVVLAAACGALVTLVLVLADNGQLRGMMFWLAGDLGWAARPWTMAGAALLATFAVSLVARPLDVLATGEITAQSLGLDLPRWRMIIVILAGILTAGAVIQGGTIGFVGMVVPHLVRLAFGTAAHRVVVPAAALAGGTLLAAADLVARTVAAPRQLPVGAIMALLGVPIFLALLRRFETARA
ncbi:MAG TPA: iron ABC transporter permease [Steroidobacteraceae bacterium]|jgi:iron complex transport system permease protein|nr:iron ABC transporter permease [Steroidobacteraceae bacterium]